MSVSASTSYEEASRAVVLLGAVSILALAGCSGGGGGGSSVPPAPTTFTIGGSVTGLSGSGLVLQNNGGSDVAIASDGAFVFSGTAAAGSNYAVTVKTRPKAPLQTCSVTGGTGTVASANVSSITVTCTADSPKLAFTANDDSVSVYAVDAATGQLRSLSYIETDGGLDALVVDPSGKFLFGAEDATGRLFAYSLDASKGQLMPVSGAPYSVDSARMVTMDATGKFVYVTSRSSGTVAAFSVNPTSGALSPVAGSPFAAGMDPIPIAIDPSNKFVYVANYGSHDISVYSIDPSTGTLAPITGSPFAVPGVVGNSSPTRMAMAPSGRFLFVNDSTGFAISVFAVNATTGALTAVAGSPYALQDPRAITVDPTGQFLYVAIANARIAGFTVDGTTGALTAIGAGSFVTDSTAHALNVDPSGKFLYAVSGGMTTVHAIDPVTGVLTQQPNGTHVTRRASAIEFLEGAGPSTLKAKFAYVGNGQASTISGYTLDNASGSLTPIAGSPFAAGSGTWGMTLTPNGKFLYAANSGAVHASGFTVNATTGALTQIAGSPFDAGRSPYSLVTDPSGRFVYSGGWKSEALVGLRIDQSTGVLASIGIGPTLFPYFVAMHPSGRFVYVGSPQESTITMFEIDVTTGTVTQAGTPFAMSPVQHMAMSPSGRFLYASVVGLTPGIVSLAIGPTGQLSGASSYNTGQRNVAATAVHPNERFIYAAVASSDTVLGFNIAPNTGVLSEFAGNSFATGDDPSMVSIDPSGKFLYVSNFGSANVSAFTINPSTGALTALSNSPFAAANGAGPMVFSATLE